jgi:hypothetical protein
VLPSYQQQCVTALQKLAQSLSIGMLSQTKQLLRLVTESKNPNDNEAAMTSGDK